MKKVYSLIIALFLSGSIFAQAPQKMSYQAVIRDASNALVASTPIGMRISILKDSSKGVAVYTETQSLTTNANGLVSMEIGNGTVLLGAFSGIDWSNGPYFVKIETDPTGGTSYSIVGVNQLLSVPYSLFSASSSGVFTHYIGELFGGGIVVGVWKVSGVEHGLIASLKDVSASAAWSNVTTTLIGAGAKSARDGQSNTASIISQAGHTSSAAFMCDTFSSGGFTDWYLPADWELNQCYNAALIVNEVLGDIDGFKIAYYWSSTEYAANYADNFTFFAGWPSGDTKDSFYRVRAVRRF